MPAITIVSQYFYPEVAATGQLLTELAVELKKRGCEVRVITGQPSYARRGKLPKKEVYKGVEIRRVWNTSLNKNRKIGRILNYITFVTSALLAVLFSRKTPLLIVSNPPFLPVIGAAMKTLRGQRYVFLVHDVYPEIAVKLGYLKEDSIISKLWRKTNKWVCGCADVVIVLGERMKERVRGYVGKQEKLRVIHNWADGNFIKPLKKSDNDFCKKLGLEDKLVVLYSGNIGLFHDLETVIKAAKKLENEDIVFLFIGEGGKKEKLKKMTEELELKNVLFLPYQPYEKLPYSLTCGDISIVSLERGVEGLAVPSKLYAYLAAGSAVIALVGQGSEVCDIIEEYKCGFRVEQGDVEGLVKAIAALKEDEKLLEEMKANARRCFEENFEKEMAVDKYYKVVAGVNKLNVSERRKRR